MDKKSSPKKSVFRLPSLQKKGRSYDKVEKSSTEIEKQNTPLEEEEKGSSISLRHRQTKIEVPVIQFPYSDNFIRRLPVHQVKDAESFNPNLRNQTKLHHSFSSLGPARKLVENDLNASLGVSELRSIFKRNIALSQECKSTSSAKVQQQQIKAPVSTLNTGSKSLTTNGMDSSSSLNHKQNFISNQCQLQSSEPLNEYVPILNATYEDHGNLIRKFDIGESNLHATEKVIIVVGATGSGKSTLINALFNYIFGVKWEDNFRLKLIEENTLSQAESITKYISSYTLHHQECFTVPYTITVIETPGFGDTQGIKRDEEIKNQIKTFFNTKGPSGIDKLDAVAFVASSSLARLTPSQKYIFQSILTIFGKDIADCIVLLLTFADSQKPQIMHSIKEANIPHRKHFKFNSSALYISNKDDDDDEGDAAMGKMFWEIGEKSFKNFVTELDYMMPTSLVLTREVLDERKQLEISIEGIQTEIKLSLGKLERLTTEVKELSSHKAGIDGGKVISYDVIEAKCVKKPILDGQKTTNCLVCSMTCHKRCRKNDEDKIKCCVMTKGYCRICPKKCSWKMHRNQPYELIYEYVKNVSTVQGIKERYEELTGTKLASEQVVKECANEFQAAKVELLSLAEAARNSIQRLEEIALKPNPLSTVEYIDILIQSEKQERNPFWMERVHQLREVRKQAEYMQQLKDKNLDPFKEYREKVDEERRENRKGVWTIVAEYVKRGFGINLYNTN